MQTNLGDYAIISKAVGLSNERCKTFCDALFGEGIVPDSKIATPHIKAVKDLMTSNNIPLLEAVKKYKDSFEKKGKKDGKPKKGSVDDLMVSDRAIAEKIATTRYELIVSESDALLRKFLSEGIPDQYQSSLMSTLSSSQDSLKQEVFDVCEGEWHWVDDTLPNGSDLLHLSLPPSSLDSPGTD